jgi:hypothetical protein
MNTQDLSGLTLQTVENYRAAATQAVKAYRLGSHRLLGAMDGVIVNSVYPRTAKIAPQATERLNGVRSTMSDAFAKGIDQVADRTEQAIGATSTLATEQLGKAVDRVAAIDNATLAGALQTASRLALPGAKVALVVSGKVAEGAAKVAKAVGGEPVKAAVKTAVRKAGAAGRRVTKTVNKTVAKAVKQAAPRKAARARAAK